MRHLELDCFRHLSLERTRPAIRGDWFTLVFRDAGIDVIRPGIDSAFEIADVVKAPLLEQSHRLRAALAAVTMDNDRLLALYLVQAFPNFTQRDQLRAIDPRNFIFEWLAHVD